MYISEDFNEIDCDFAEVEADVQYPTFTWKNNDYYCIPATTNDMVKAIRTGYNENNEFEMTVRTSQFNGVLPQLNDPITYRGNQFLIYNIKTPLVGGIIVLVCKYPST